MIDIAISLAAAIPYERHKKRLCAILLDKRNRLVSVGYNSYDKTERKMYEYGKRAGNPHKCYPHAEVSAIIKDKAKRGVKLIVARVDAEGKPALAKPCESCMLAIKDHGKIKSIEFTF